ncbi:MAG: fimbrillin family protein [Rikenellaceae bacterium]|nr:fimbrillin family protein [Rikenellaceae bacterium]
MNIRKLLSVFGVLITVFAVSCTSEKDFTPDVGEKVEAIFTAGISTRVSDVLWDPYDAIGITMVDRNAGTIVDNMSNIRYYTTTSAGSFLPTTTAVYFPQDGSDVTFKSYYPYNASVGTDLKIPVSVANQTNLPEIDLMTAKHLSGYNKNTQYVSLRFHHRLSKVIFRLYNGEEQVELQPGDLSVLIKGMKTTGTYDVFAETLTVDDNSVADLTIPRGSTASERTGIVLPREAGPGVTFELSHANGSLFTAEMSDTLQLKPGYKYVFNVIYTGNDLSISVTIEDWIEGPTTSYDVLGVGTSAGDSYGVQNGDQLQVYVQNGNDYENLTIFTYNSGTGRWTSASPVYWDEIDDSQSSINLRAALSATRLAAANSTQMADIILADPLNVARNTGADFTLRHAGSRVVVQLSSDVFTSTELAEATITLPDYLYGGYQEKGEFIYGTSRQDILVDRTDASDQYAIIQPQSVSPDAALVSVNIKEKDFTARADATEGFLYEPGTAYELVLLINESDVSVSARVIDWTPSGPHYFEVLQVSSAGETEGVEVGTTMRVYRSVNGNYLLWNDFTYVGSNIWTAATDMYWSDIPGDGVDLRATIVAVDALNNTQMADYLVTDELYVEAYQSANFVFRHVGSKATVKVVSDVFSDAMLAAARITMPDYLTGGSLVNGEFVPGSTVADVVLERDDASLNDDGYNHVAIVQPQTIAAGDNLFVVTIGGNSYYAKAPSTGFEFEAGVNYAVVISVNEDAVTVSATVIDWETRTINLNAFTIDAALPNASSGVLDGEQMQVYYESGTERIPLTSFTYTEATDTWTADSSVFWEDKFAGQSTVTFHASILRQAAYNSTQVDDYLIADPIDVVFGQPANFTLRHKAARVDVQLTSQDNTFSTEELAAMEMVLENYLNSSDYDNGVYTVPANLNRGNIRIEKVGTGAVAIIPEQSVAVD